MDKYSFLNAAHTSFFAELYDQYLKNPDSVEPSWRAFFQGFDFGSESISDQIDLDSAGSQSIRFSKHGNATGTDHKNKEFKV